MNTPRLLLALVFALSLTACGSRLTSDNLQKIHNGMTPQEVKAILGSPASVETSGALGLTGTTYSYKSGTSEVKIVFLNDKVMATQGDFK